MESHRATSVYFVSNKRRLLAKKRNCSVMFSTLPEDGKNISQRTMYRQPIVEVVSSLKHWKSIMKFFSGIKMLAEPKSTKIGIPRWINMLVLKGKKESFH